MGYAASIAFFLVLAAAVWSADRWFAAQVRSFAHGIGSGEPLREFLRLVRPWGQGEVLALGALLLGVCGRRRLSKQIILALLATAAIPTAMPTRTSLG